MLQNISYFCAEIYKIRHLAQQQFPPRRLVHASKHTTASADTQNFRGKDHCMTLINQNTPFSKSPGPSFHKAAALSLLEITFWSGFRGCLRPGTGWERTGDPQRARVDRLPLGDPFHPALRQRNGRGFLHERRAFRNSCSHGKADLSAASETERRLSQERQMEWDNPYTLFEPFCCISAHYGSFFDRTASLEYNSCRLMYS